MERKQKGGRKAERKEGNRRNGSEAGAKTNYAMTLGVAKEATASSAGDNRTCSNRGSISQIRYSLVVILGLNSVSEVQYKDMMIDR